MTHPTTTPPPVVSVTVLHTAARLIRDYTQCGQHLDGALRDELDHVARGLGTIASRQVLVERIFRDGEG